MWLVKPLKWEAVIAFGADLFINVYDIWIRVRTAVLGLEHRNLTPS